MSKRTLSLFVALLVVAVLWLAPQAADDAKVEAIKKVIQKAYIEGVHINQDAAAMRRGFHPEFRMMVYAEDKINPVSIDQWAGGVEERSKNNPTPSERKVDHEFTVVDVAGNAAVARVEVHFDGKHVFTDYLSLYEFSDGWKIVGKIFYRQ